MNKKWEEEVKKLLSKQYGGKTALNDMFGQQIEKFVEEDLKEWLNLLAKREKELLARVREEVIGEEEKINIQVKCSECGEFNPTNDKVGIRNEHKKEQLKKLEIISEKGK